MHARLQTSKAKRMAKLRSSTVEPALGTLINFTGTRRIWTRALAGATTFLLGAAIAYNLKKWMRFKEKKVNVAVMVKKTPAKCRKKLQNQLFFSFRLSHTPLNIV